MKATTVPKNVAIVTTQATSPVPEAMFAPGMTRLP